MSDLIVKVDWNGKPEDQEWLAKTLECLSPLYKLVTWQGWPSHPEDKTTVCLLFDRRCKDSI